MIAPLPIGTNAGDTFIATPHTMPGYFVLTDTAGKLVFRHIVAASLEAWAEVHNVTVMHKGWR